MFRTFRRVSYYFGKERVVKKDNLRDLVAELPFILMHPKPEEETPAPTSGSRRSSKDVGADVPVDANLIQLDAYVMRMRVFKFSVFVLGMKIICKITTMI